MYKFYSVLFILTGVLAIIGGLYTWGDGNILLQNELVQVLIPWADIIITGPLSIIGGIGLRKRKHAAFRLCTAVSGIYIFGSVMVFITMIWNKSLSIFLLIPALSGLMIGVAFLLFISRNTTILIKNN